MIEILTTCDICGMRASDEDPENWAVIERATMRIDGTIVDISPVHLCPLHVPAALKQIAEKRRVG